MKSTAPAVKAASPVAALYVEERGSYSEAEGVEAWHAKRDAREYAGPHPVVAHPPCNWWAMPLSKVNRTRYGHAIGRDAGKFAHALWAVKTFGGVLEHPANTSAWEFFGLTKPTRGCWTPAGEEWRWGTGKRFWTCQVSQSAYGHLAIKRTWLFYAGHAPPPSGDWCEPPPPSLDWTEPPARAVTSWLQRTNTTLPRITKRAAMPTPPAFRDALLALARQS